LTTDFKAPPRVKDKDALKAFHEDWLDCLACGGRPIQAHHILSRARGGDDARGNLVGLCAGCHGAYHGSPYTGAFGKRIDAGFVRSAIARYIRHESGDDARWYLTAKLGPEASIAFLESLDT